MPFVCEDKAVLSDSPVRYPALSPQGRRGHEMEQAQRRYAKGCPSTWKGAWEVLLLTLGRDNPLSGWRILYLKDSLCERSREI